MYPEDWYDLATADLHVAARFRNSLCLWLHISSNVSKWEVPRTKPLPVKSLKRNDTVQISSYLTKVNSCCWNHGGDVLSYGVSPEGRYS
ncbi:unnamed protein product [Caretta caretta]